MPLLLHANSSFLYLSWYRFPLLAFGFPNPRHRDSVWTQVTLKTWILLRVCWSLNSFPWPITPSRVSAEPLHSASSTSSHAFPPCLHGSSHAGVLYSLPNPFWPLDFCPVLFVPSISNALLMAHILQVSVKYQLLEETSADHHHQEATFLLIPLLHTLLLICLIALNKLHGDPICLLSYFCLRPGHMFQENKDFVEFSFIHKKPFLVFVR